MRKLIAFLFLIPVLTFSQTEREQKTAIRNNSSFPSTQSSPSFKSSSESSEKYIIRNNTQKYTPNPPVRYNYGYDYFSSPFGLNRWYRWGAPINGFSFYDDWFYYDRFGFRQPARIYVYNDGRRDTIRGNKTHIRTGVSYSTNRQIGGWLTIGNNHYFMVEYLSRTPKDFSTFYDDVTMDLAIRWNDQRVADLFTDNVLFLGVGKKISDLTFHVLVGLGREKVNYQFYDDLLILSNNGYYSFKNYHNPYTTLKFGMIKDFKLFSVKGDYDPFRNSFNLGLGIIW